LKLIYSILISFLLLVPSVSNVFIYLNFKVHQEEIAKNLCIQKEMKQNKCNGHCYLSKQLQKAAEKEKKESENIKEKQEIVYLPCDSTKQTITTFSVGRSRIAILYSSDKPKSAQIGIFRPPLI
jgi:hypothetical protein